MKNSAFFSCLMCGILTFSSCETYDDLVPSEYHHILNLKQYGMQRLSLYTTGEDAVYKFTVMKGGSEVGNAATAKIEVMAEEEFNTYAKDNNVAESYLPADKYKIHETQLNFASDETYKFGEVTLKTVDIKKLMDETQKKYVLPIRMVSSDCTVKNNLLLIQLDVETPTIAFNLADGNKFAMVSSFTSSDPQTQTAEFNVTFPMPNQWDFTFDANTDEQAMQAFNEYNAKFDNKFTLLPEKAYKFNGKGISFPKDATSMSLSVTIDASKLSCGEYILPLHLCNLSNKNFETDTQNDIVLLGVKYVPKKLDLKVSQLSTNSVEDGDGTGLSGLIDGDLEGTGYFHSKWSAPVQDAVYGNYIDLNIGKTLHSLSFDYWTRKQNGNGAPRFIRLFVSDDGSIWRKLQDINKGLPGSGNTKYSSAIFTDEEGFSYVRFAVLVSAAGDMTNSASYFNLHELTFYGE